MFNLTKTLCAALALTFAAGTAVPLNAAPLVAPTGGSDRAIVNVQDPGGTLRRDRREQRFEARQDRRERRFERRQDRREARFERRGNYGYYNGRRGYRERRPGYRYYQGFWFPPAAFIAGAVIGNAINNASGSRSAHVQWCYDRYRSYRASDNTFQPYNGPRQQCYSPYS